jgi:hypothetical protein
LADLYSCLTSSETKFKANGVKPKTQLQK